MLYGVCIGRNKNNNEIVFISKVSNELSYDKVNEIIDKQYDKENNNYEVYEDKQIYEIISYFDNKNKNEYEVDYSDWKELNNKISELSDILYDMKYDVDNISLKIDDRLKRNG